LIYIHVQTLSISIMLTLREVVTQREDSDCLVSGIATRAAVVFLYRELES